MKKKCAVAGCHRLAYGRGLCNAHYQRVVVLGSLNEDVPIKEIGNHGLSRHPLYDVWKGIIRRCTDINCAAYDRYGGRGIGICERWMQLENFIADMHPRPAGSSIERIDNNGNYEPSNCRWSSYKEQANNTRSNRWLTLNGVTLTTSEWARNLGISRRTITTRLDRHGWSVEKALTTSPRQR
jgi:hypothetical protein